ncbi:MAG: triose-phosphate isomerase [Alphaproteobacteria bacterium]|nr:triose-phosphate isomerase [Alphaproteobacteria bacterium]
MKFIIANWKMNGNLSLIEEFKGEFSNKRSNEEVKVIICPPVSLINKFVSEKCEKTLVGAQNCFYKDSGAFTGENSPKLLKELGCEYVILGHSERRNIFNESDELIFNKWNAAITKDLTPILCIGEKADERSRWKDVLAAQLESYYKDSSLDFHGTIFAYEPVWSIGTGKIPSVEEIGEVMMFIRNLLGSSKNYYVVYGGSVNGDNASDILKISELDGVLVGSASLKPDEFKKIIDAA